MQQLIGTFCDLLENGEDLVLATIVSQSGSTPRTAGAKMVVRSNGRTLGTVGGGLVEAKVIDTALKLFDSRMGCIKPFDLTSTEVRSDMDLICGGRLEILVEFIASNADNLTVFKALQRAVKKGEMVTLAAEMDPGRDELKTRRFLIRADGTFVGSGTTSEQTAAGLVKQARRTKSSSLVNLDGRQFVVEPWARQRSVFIFGAGHVSQEVASFTQAVDFYTVVLDDRREFCNPERFGTADELLVLDNFENAFNGLNIGAASAVIILTRGHSHDQTVLAQALGTSAGYIGMIGSRRKRDLIYRSLLDEGFTMADLQRVHSPIGLSIGAETPAEIAVSIVAELIKVGAQANVFRVDGGLIS